MDETGETEESLLTCLGKRLVILNGLLLFTFIFFGKGEVVLILHHHSERK